MIVDGFVLERSLGSSGFKYVTPSHGKFFVQFRNGHGGVTRKSEVRGTGDARSSRRARVASRALARAGSRATARDRVLR